MQSGPAQIRVCRASDVEDLIELWRQCDLLAPQNDPQQDIRRKMAHSPDLFLLAEVERKVIGSVMGGYDGHRGWINYLAVAPATRRQGFGRKLLHEITLRLRAQGCPKINLQVREGNEDAIAFYRRLGYRRDHVLSLGLRLDQRE